MLQLDREHAEVYLEPLSQALCFEALEFAVKEAIRLDERFPKVPRLIELGRRWKRPQHPADLSRPALPEITPEQAALNLERVNELIRRWDAGELSSEDFERAAQV